MDLNLNGLKLIFTKIEGSENAWDTEGINGCNEETFIKKTPLRIRVFLQSLILIKMDIFQKKNIIKLNMQPERMVF